MSNDYSGGTTINAGTIKLGNANALGCGTLVINGGTTAVPGGTLDLNHTVTGNVRRIMVQGVGVGSLGAIVNNSTSTYSGNSNDVPNTVTLSGDTTFGGTADVSTTNSGLPLTRHQRPHTV